MSASVSIRSTLRRASFDIPFDKIASFILPNKYELSLVLCGDSLACNINTKYRNKTYKPNVLSFELSDISGEIFLNAHCAEREARIGDIDLESRLAYLFIHGCCHLKGLKHGSTMETVEQQVIKMFKIRYNTDAIVHTQNHDKTLHRHRHRITQHQSCHSSPECR